MSFQQERTRAGTRLFHPEEVATVIDMFAPVRHALEHARSGPRRPVWHWREWRVPALVALAILTVGVTGATLQARAVVVSPPPAPPPIHTPPAPVPAAAAPIVEALPATEEIVVPPPAPIPRVPRARPPGDEEALAALNRRAVSEYERSRPAAAVRLLSEALRLCQRPALAWNPACATTHVNLGRVLVGGYRQSGLAAKHFRIADAIRPGSATAGERALRTALTSGDRSTARGR